VIGGTPASGVMESKRVRLLGLIIKQPLIVEMFLKKFKVTDVG
jgi:hypothetical protein